MKIVTRFEKGAPGAKGRARYNDSDKYLTYDPDENDGGSRIETKNLSDKIDVSFGIKREKRLLLIADTLTIDFRGDQMALHSLDACTNKELWNEDSRGRIPDVSGEGALSVDGEIDDDRCTIDSTPEYLYSRDGGYVRIIIRSGNAVEYFNVGSGLVVGLDGDQIAEIFLLDVEYE